jgi:hypothetical protein
MSLDARMSPKHPNDLKHLNVDGCSLPSIVSQLPKLLRSDHGIRFVNEQLVRTPGRLSGIYWLATYPTIFPERPSRSLEFRAFESPLQEDGAQWALKRCDTRRTLLLAFSRLPIVLLTCYRSTLKEMGLLNYKICSAPAASNPIMDTRPDTCPITRTSLRTAAHVAR